MARPSAAGSHKSANAISHPIALNRLAFVASRTIALTGTPASRNFNDVE
jgi:hypothetical protein